MPASIDVSYLEPDSAYYKLHYAKDSNAMGIEIFVTDSDGGRIRLPEGKDRGRVLTEEGIYDYYEEASKKDSQHWRKKIGGYAAKHLLHRSQVTGYSEDQSFLKRFPDGYKLYVHYKGEPGKERKDLYLLGSKWVHQFRSPAEFFLHFHWMVAGMPMNDDDEPNCQCTYCSGNKQADISEIYSRYHPKRPLGSGSEDDEEARNAASRSRAGPSRPRAKRAPRTPSPPIQIKDYTVLRKPSGASDT